MIRRLWWLCSYDLGRGLGHTGGTLDKLESIPGYNIMPSNKVFGDVTKEAGVAIIGQNRRLSTG